MTGYDIKKRTAGRKITARNIEIFEGIFKDELAVLEFFRTNLEHVLEEKDHLYYYLTVLFAIEIYESYLRWCEKTKMFLFTEE